MESEAAALSVLDVPTDERVPVRNSMAPISMAIFAASNFASFFLAKTGWVEYERRTPSGLVIVKIHCLSVMEVRGSLQMQRRSALLELLCSMNSNFKASVFRKMR